MTDSERSGPSTGSRIALLAFAQLIISVDYNIVYVGLPSIGRGLGFSAQSLQWVVSGYAVGFGGFLLLGGRAVDRLGARRMFVGSLVLFGLASLGGGFAQATGELVAFRIVQGLGGAVIFPATLALINTRFAEGPERNRAMSLWGAAGSSGVAVGVLCGGVLTQYAGWRWVFFVNVPLSLIAAAAALVLLDPDPVRHRATRGFDLPGAILATVASAFVVLGLVDGPATGWLSWRGLGFVAIGLILFGFFLLLESRTADPLVPLQLLKVRTLVAAMVLIFVFMGMLNPQYYLVTTDLQTVLGFDPLRAGLAFLPLSAASVYGSTRILPFLLRRFGLATTLSIGLLGTSLSMAVTSAGMSAHGSYWALLPGILLRGFSAGTTFTSLFLTAGSGVPKGRQGVASALASTSQQLGGAIGLAVLVAIADAGLPLKAGVAAAPAAAIVHGLRNAGFVGAAVTFVGAGLSLAMRGPLRQAGRPAQGSEKPAQESAPEPQPTQEQQPGHNPQQSLDLHERPEQSRTESEVSVSGD